MRPFRLLITCATCLAAATAAPALAASAQYTGPRFGYAVAAAGFRSYFVFDTASGAAVAAATVVATAFGVAYAQARRQMRSGG
jgi:hypothetical protein